VLLAVRAVPDILSQGGDSEPRPWRRRVVAAAVLVLAGVVIAWHVPWSSRSSVRPAGAAAGVIAAVPDGLIGPALPWPGGLRLPEAGPQPAWFSPGTGQTVPVGGLPPQRSGYEFIPGAGGWAVQAALGPQAGCGNCAGPPRAVYFLADHAQTVTRVGTANAVAPAAAGALWLTTYPPGAGQATAVGTAHEVSTAGAPLGPQFRLPPGYLIEQATGRGLLLAPAAPRPGTTAWQLREPGAPQPIRTFDAVIAASATQVAQAPTCATICRVQVVNLATGRQLTAELPAGRSAVNAAFSPDGRFLAVETSFSNEGDDGGQAVTLELLSTSSGSQMAVPGTALSSDALIGFGWPPGGDTLVAELSFTTKVQLMSWHPGAARLAVAALGPQQSPASLIIGQYTP
jgi:hypothetical protein